MTDEREPSLRARVVGGLQWLVVAFLGSRVVAGLYDYLAMPGESGGGETVPFGKTIVRQDDSGTRGTPDGDTAVRCSVTPSARASSC